MTFSRAYGSLLTSDLYAGRKECQIRQVHAHRMLAERGERSGKRQTRSSTQSDLLYAADEGQGHPPLTE